MFSVVFNKKVFGCYVEWNYKFNDIQDNVSDYYVLCYDEQSVCDLFFELCVINIIVKSIFFV